MKFDFSITIDVKNIIVFKTLKKTFDREIQPVIFYHKRVFNSFVLS